MPSREQIEAILLAYAILVAVITVCSGFYSYGRIVGRQDD